MSDCSDYYIVYHLPILMIRLPFPCSVCTAYGSRECSVSWFHMHCTNVSLIAAVMLNLHCIQAYIVTGSMLYIIYVIQCIRQYSVNPIPPASNDSPHSQQMKQCPELVCNMSQLRTLPGECCPRCVGEHVQHVVCIRAPSLNTF